MKRHVLRFEQASLLVVVMLTAFLMISCFPRNPNTLPVADFKLVESSATELRQLHFDASTSTDKEDSTDKLIARWDFNGDGVWEIDYSANKKANEVVSHSYNVAGTTTVVVEVKDSKGLTSRKEKEILINLAPPQSLYLESFSDNEITIVWNDLSTSEDSYNVSLNDNPLEQLPANTEEYTFELDTSATQTISVYCTKGTMKSNKTELVMGMNLSESTTVFEEVSITLPASHVGGEVRIEVSQQTQELPEGCNPLSSIYDIDIELSDDATFFPIKLAFDPSYEPSNGSDMIQLILHFDSDSGIWVPMMTSIGEDSNLVTYTSSFSEFVAAEVPANSAILNVKIVDFDAASRGLTFSNSALNIVDADNKMAPYNYSAEEIQEVARGFCYGMSVVSAATYINNLPRDPYFEFDNNDLLGYLIISRDGESLLYRTPQEINHLTSCSSIIGLITGEQAAQLLSKIEMAFPGILVMLDPTIQTMSNFAQVTEAITALSTLKLPVVLLLRHPNIQEGGHAVVAYGFNIAHGDIDFLIYDPNYPFEEKVLSINQDEFGIEGEYGEKYKWFFAQSGAVFAKSVLLEDALEGMIEEAYAPRFKGLYYTPEDGIIHLSLWNHNRPDNHNTPLLEVLKKENGGSYGTLRSYMNLDTTQTFVDEDVSQLNTYTYKLSRSDGKTSDEYSIFTRDMTIVPSDGSFISPDATLTINVTDSLGLDNIRAYNAVKHFEYPYYVLIDGKRENGNVEVGADLLKNCFGVYDSLQLMIVGDCEDGFIVREVTYFPSDNASPTVTKISGPDGEISENSSTFTWTGSDPDGTITKYEYRKDDGVWTDHALNTSYTWSGYSEGAHTFEVRAQDNDDQYSDAVSWSFTYSTGTVVVGEMVLVEGGTFMMGDTWGDGFDNELPVHQVTLTYNFEIGKYELTFDEYDAFCEATGRSKPNDYGWGRETRPAIYVSWWDAIAYCNWLSEKNGLPKAYNNSGNLLDASGKVTTDITKVLGYRLPTEAEWEYAARGGKHRSPYKYSGSDNVDIVAWYSNNSGGRTHEVGQKLPNALGIYDMSGNVWEWCSDWWYYYTETPKTNPYNSTAGSGRVGRGGCWGSKETYVLRVAYRDPASPTFTGLHLGFRICRTLSSTDEEAPTMTWQKYFGGSGSEGAYSVQQTNDGGYVVFGGTDSNDGDVSGNHGKNDFWVLKLDSTGSIQWQKCLGGSAEESCNLGEMGSKASVQQTSDGGYVIVGYTNSNDGDVSGNHGSCDIWIVKLSSTGNIQWQKCLGGSSEEYGYSIQQTSDGGYVVAGATDSNDGDVSGNRGSEDVWVVKLNSTGSIQWQKCLGGSGLERATSVQQTSDGGYVIVGYTNSNDGDVSGNRGGYDIWVVKLSSTGNIQWQKCLGGSAAELAYSVKQTSDGGYVVAGATQSNDGDVSGNHGGYDIWVVKLSSTGNIQWQKCFGSDGPYDLGLSISQTSDSGYVVVGYTGSGILIKLDNSGSINWQMCFDESGYDNILYSVKQTSDNGYIVAGASLNHEENADLWLLKLD